MSKQTLAERFWAKVSKSSLDLCWMWTAARNKRGYGVIVDRDVSFLAHRLSWSLANGAIPSGLCVLHKCDVRACVNPDHLFLGTHLDNMADKTAKGRQARGSKSWNAKLSEADVLAIRKTVGSAKEVAAQYGVGVSIIGDIRRRQRWGHLP